MTRRGHEPEPAGSARPTAHAGRFYPADAERLRKEVEGYITSGAARAGAVPKAIIAPHAGYVYSGPVAGSAYAAVVPGHAIIRRVVLIGPAHYVPFEGLASAAFATHVTPLGPVRVDSAARSQLATIPSVQILDEAHVPEHALEVQLPFLQVALDEFTIVPLLVGRASPADVQTALALLWGGPETLIVVSSDLSHYHDHATARKWDRRTADKIEALDSVAIAPADACGATAIRGLLELARAQGLHARTLDLRTSGDTAGTRDRVVGYGAFAFGLGET